MNTTPWYAAADQNSKVVFSTEKREKTSAIVKKYFVRGGTTKSISGHVYLIESNNPQIVARAEEVAKRLRKFGYKDLCVDTSNGDTVQISFGIYGPKWMRSYLAEEARIDFFSALKRN